jgi:gluconate kinase
LARSRLSRYLGCRRPGSSARTSSVSACSALREHYQTRTALHGHDPTWVFLGATYKTVVVSR